MHYIRGCITFKEISYHLPTWELYGKNLCQPTWGQLVRVHYLPSFLQSPNLSHPHIPKKLVQKSVGVTAELKLGRDFSRIWLQENTQAALYLVRPWSVKCEKSLILWNDWHQDSRAIFPQPYLEILRDLLHAKLMKKDKVQSGTRSNSIAPSSSLSSVVEFILRSMSIMISVNTLSQWKYSTIEWWMKGTWQKHVNGC